MAQEELQQVGHQLQQLQNYLEMLEEQSQELTTAQEALTQIQDVAEGTNIYAPLSKGVYIGAQLTATQTIQLHVGGDIVVEKTPAEAIDILSQQTQEIAQVQENMVKQFSQLYQQYVQLQMGQ